MCANIKSWKPATCRPPSIPKDVGSAILSVNHLTEPSRMLQEFRQATSVETWLSLERAEHVSAVFFGERYVEKPFAPHEKYESRF